MIVERPAEYRFSVSSSSFSSFSRLSISANFFSSCVDIVHSLREGNCWYLSAYTNTAVFDIASSAVPLISPSSYQDSLQYAVARGAPY